jgi:GNAT superfamily N-acetyltransferase
VTRSDLILRAATIDDCAIIARQRVSMFVDMGFVKSDDAAGELHRLTVAWLAERIPRGEYVGWLATPVHEPERVVAGAGAQLRRVLPFPKHHNEQIADGRQAIVVNVYTEPEFRRRGVARLLMTALLNWARSIQLESLVLHATADGKPLYESLGFRQTNEMRLFP